VPYIPDKRHNVQTKRKQEYLCKKQETTVYAQLSARFARHGGRYSVTVARIQNLFVPIGINYSALLHPEVKRRNSEGLACRASAVETGFRSHRLRSAIPQRRTPVARELVANATAAKQK
jgi:hypothetical protein